jgi:hypothetical protein
MPSVIQPPASGNVGMPSGGNAYSGNQPGVSPSTRDLYSLPDYSGGMRGGMGGDDRLDRLLKMLSSYMGSQMAPPSAAPPPAPVEATPPSIDQSEPQKPVEYTGGSQLPAQSPAPSPAAPSPSFNMPVMKFGPGYTPATPRAIPKGLKDVTNFGMEDYYNAQTGERYSGGIGMAEPGSGWSTRGQTGYVARDYSKEPPPDMVRIGGSGVAPSTPAAPPPSPSPNMPVNEYQPGYTRTSVPAGINAPNPFTATTSAMGEMYNTNTGQRYTTTSGGYSAEPGSGWVSQGQPGYVATTSGGTPRQATPAPSDNTFDDLINADASIKNKYKSLRQTPYIPSNSDPSSPENQRIYFHKLAR